MSRSLSPQILRLKRLDARTFARQNRRMITWNHPFIVRGNITSVWGYSEEYFNNERLHRGMDYNPPNAGTPVYSVASGLVEYAGPNTNFELGNQVTIAHADGYRSCYGHLLDGSIVVQAGQQVSGSQQVAQLGSSNTPAAHLHIEIWTGPDRYAQHTNPYPYIHLAPLALTTPPPTNTENEEDMAKIIVSCTDIAAAGGQTGNKSFVVFGPAREGYPVVEVTTNQNRINGLLFARGKNLAQFDYTSLPNLSFAQMVDAVKLETGMNAASQNSYVNGFRWPAA